jgi:hypothetical protein
MALYPYRSLSIIVLGLYVAGHIGLFLAVHVIPPLVGINFSMIIIRISQGFGNHSGSGTTLPTVHRLSQWRSGVNASGSATGNIAALKVTVSQQVKDDTEFQMVVVKSPDNWDDSRAEPHSQSVAA